MKDDRDRGSVDIDDWEIALIQGLYDHGMSQQEIIARFSFPHRTLHHNIVSDINNRAAWCSENAYDPGSPLDCDAFLRLTNSTPTEHLWALSRSRHTFPLACKTQRATSTHPPPRSPTLVAWFSY